MDRLATAAGTSARTRHDFYKVIFCLAFFDPLDQTSGIAKTRRLIERIKKGEAEYDFVEVMACPGGCAGGGGQPIHDNLELAKERGDVLYELDAENEIRFSHENPAVQELYRSFLEKPLSHKSHELLHTDHSLGI